MNNIKIKRALISVSDKSGLAELARVLKGFGAEIITTGGTKVFLDKHKIKTTPVEKITGFDKTFGGRLKTLNSQIFASILFDRGSSEDVLDAASAGIEPIDLVVCNPYPFVQKSKESMQIEELIEDIDIGGVALIRAAAKNYQYVAVVSSTKDYHKLMATIRQNGGGTTLSLRKHLACRAFEQTTLYDSAIADSFEADLGFCKKTFTTSPLYSKTLRYGENPHQKGFLYFDVKAEGLAQAEQTCHGELSYNNYLDANSAVEAVCDIAKNINSVGFGSVCTIIKHSNPCGAAMAKTPPSALKLAWSGDPKSSFGSVICFSDKLNSPCAEFLSDKFVEVVIAPDFDPDALNILTKKRNLRLIRFPNLCKSFPNNQIRSISGGWLVQTADNQTFVDFKTATTKSFPKAKLPLARFGIAVAKNLKSNAISIVAQSEEGLYLVGAGMGNPSRVQSVKQAIDKALENGFKNFAEAILVSDAFFPFEDNISLIAEAGIGLVVQPGGSIRDKKVVQACNKNDIAMVFTQRRCFLH